MLGQGVSKLLPRRRKLATAPESASGQTLGDMVFGTKERYIRGYLFELVDLNCRDEEIREFVGRQQDDAWRDIAREINTRWV